MPLNIAIDQPFMGAIHTISGSLKKKYPEIWTLQIEINCGTTNKKVNFDKFEKLLKVLKNLLNSIENFDIK